MQKLQQYWTGQEQQSVSYAPGICKCHNRAAVLEDTCTPLTSPDVVTQLTHQPKRFVYEDELLHVASAHTEPAPVGLLLKHKNFLLSTVPHRIQGG